MKSLEKAMTGMDAFVYAAGVDERVEFPHPVYDAYKSIISTQPTVA